MFHRPLGWYGSYCEAQFVTRTSGWNKSKHCHSDADCTESLEPNWQILRCQGNLFELWLLKPEVFAQRDWHWNPIFDWWISLDFGARFLWKACVYGKWEGRERGRGCRDFEKQTESDKLRSRDLTSGYWETQLWSSHATLAARQIWRTGTCYFARTQKYQNHL